MVIVRSLLVAALGAVVATPALGQECSQARAIYGDRDGAYELRFEPVGSESAVTSNLFKIAVLKPGLLLDGVVMPSGEPERATGIVMHKCPTGDVTGEELRKCTVWQGPVYSVGKTGAIDAIPAETAPAAHQILLPDFGPALHASSAWGKGKAETDSWDAFTLKGCAE